MVGEQEFENIDKLSTYSNFHTIYYRPIYTPRNADNIWM